MEAIPPADIPNTANIANNTSTDNTPLAEEVEEFRQARDNQNLQDSGLIDDQQLRQIEELLGQLEQGQLSGQQLQELSDQLEGVLGDVQQQAELEAARTQVAAVNSMIVTSMIESELFSGDMLSSSLSSLGDPDPYGQVY